MSWSTWQDGRWRRRNHCGCIHSEGTQDHNKLQHRRAARESLKEAVTCSNWPWVQLLLGLIDIQEKPVMNTKDILEKNPNVLNTVFFFFFVEITVIPDLKFCVCRKWPRSIYFVFLFKQNSLPRTINKEFNKTNNRTCTHMDMHMFQKHLNSHHVICFLSICLLENVISWNPCTQIYSCVLVIGKRLWGNSKINPFLVFFFFLISNSPSSLVLSKYLHVKITERKAQDRPGCFYLN